VFLLVNEDTVRKYKTDLADEIEPAINELIERAEQGLKALEKKASALQTKVLCIHVLYFLSVLMHDKVESARSRPTGATTAQKLEARRLQMLTKQRERLEEEVKALEVEVEALVVYTSRFRFFQTLKILTGTQSFESVIFLDRQGRSFSLLWGVRCIVGGVRVHGCPVCHSLSRPCSHCPSLAASTHDPPHEQWLTGLGWAWMSFGSDVVCLQPFGGVI